jgi:hypothetical protein
MPANESITLWLTSGITPRSRYSRTAGVMRVIGFETLLLKLQELTASGAEIARVVVDHHLPQLHILRLLSALPHSFRGDLIYMASNESGFLSAVGPHDGRFLFELSRKDIDFYFNAIFEYSPVKEYELQENVYAFAG